MSAECFPVTVLPHVSRLYVDYLAGGAGDGWYGADPATVGWMGRDVAVADASLLADALDRQAKEFGAGHATVANIEKLRRGARAVVTGQQVGLFGGPLLTLLKAATAVARAREATAATGVEHVPMFWLATEDHDLEEVNQVSLPEKLHLETLHLAFADEQIEVGSVVLPDLSDTLARVSELLGYAPVCDLLAECYVSGRTMGLAFARWMSALFAQHGLIVLDAAGRDFHRLGQAALREAIERASEFETTLLGRTGELEAAGYQAQVLVKQGASLLFLVDAVTGRRDALRRSGETWKSGGRSYSSADLLTILDEAPERLSPNALLRPIFQDTILPTAAYIGGPAEVAYFAQSAVLYRGILGRVTPILPRFSATLIEPKIGEVMKRDEVSLDKIFEAGTVEALTQWLGARAMPIEGKRKLAAVGNAMDAELAALTDYLGSMDASLGQSAGISANKMRYQMNRLRRLSASFEVQKEASLQKHAQAIMLHLLPDGHPQERVIAGLWFLAQGDGLVDRLVQEAGDMCVGHAVVRLSEHAV